MLEPIDIDPLKIERIFIASTGGQAACLVTTHAVEIARALKRS